MVRSQPSVGDTVGPNRYHRLPVEFHHWCLEETGGRCREVLVTGAAQDDGTIGCNTDAEIENIAFVPQICYMQVRVLRTLPTGTIVSYR